MIKEIVKYKHTVNSGDLIAALAGMKSVYDKTGGKAHIFQELNVPAEYYIGAYHPVRSEKNAQVTMNIKQWELLKPLLLSQEYVYDAEIYTGQPIDVNLDKIRLDIFCNMPYGMLPSWIFYAYPDMECDLSKPWLEIKGEYPLKNKIILNFTHRYRNNHTDFFFLKEYQDELIFAGTIDECEDFNDKWNLSIPYLEVKDFLELAIIIKQSKFVLSNQSTVWNIANAMMHPRLLEISTLAPNCQPFIGEKNYAYFNQGCLNYYFEKLNK